MKTPLLVLGVVLLMVLLLSRITTNNTERPAVGALGNVDYVWEPQGKLCFAAMTSTTYLGYKVTSFTIVPENRCGK